MVVGIKRGEIRVSGCIYAVESTLFTEAFAAGQQMTLEGRLPRDW